MMKRSARIFLASLLLLCASLSADAQARAIHVDYTVAVADVDKSLFHVTAEVKNVNQPRLELSLPTWTPGWYTIENYAKNILRFKVTDEKGAPLPHMMTKKQTWSVETQGHSAIKAEFDYRANVLGLNQAKITKDFSLFTGTELFLQASGARNSPSTVKIIVPAGWKIISALKETSDPTVFIAADYDVLVDAPTALGNFDVTRFEVEGKPHYFVTMPAGELPQENAQKVTEVLAKVATAESAVFGGLPYEKYVYFFILRPAESNAGGALEHLNAFVSFFARSNLKNVPPEDWSGVTAHEFFHLWNVKRIRPAEMWPYDYSRENETPLLWVSEGITSYYGPLSIYRAGIRDRKWFLSTVSGAIGGVENDDARRYISPSESSASTWLGYDTPVAFGISYYTQGENLGALLDLSIRHDTNGGAGLDDVMRGLYRDFYQRGKGFTTEDLIGVINRVSKKDYHEFFRKYVWGVEVPDYDTILGYAGYRAEKKNVKRPSYGFGLRRSGNDALAITRVDPGTPAAAAGLQPGDVILKADDTAAMQFRWFDDANVGKTLKLNVRRGSDEKELSLTVGAQDEMQYSIVDAGAPTADQVKIREAWLKTGN